jgi:hypothetical protein
VRKFTSKADGTYQEPIKTVCPHCTGVISFYTTLNYNQCKLCQKVLPFPIRMAKDASLRVAYHVQAEADCDSCKQTNVRNMYMRGGD